MDSFSGDESIRTDRTDWLTNMDEHVSQRGKRSRRRSRARIVNPNGTIDSRGVNKTAQRFQSSRFYGESSLPGLLVRIGRSG